MSYQDLAHIVIPKRFFWETESSPKYRNGFRQQDIEALSRELTSVEIPHRLSDLLLEIKLY